MGLLWVGAIIGALVSVLSNWVISSVTVAKLPQPLIPVATVIVWIVMIVLLCYTAAALSWMSDPSERYLRYLHIRRIVLQRLHRWRR